MINEHLIKLALEAGIIDYIDNETPRRYYIFDNVDVENAEKFAELIVKDCIIELERCTLRNGNSEHNLALYEAMSRIRNKFGMELK